MTNKSAWLMSDLAKIEKNGLKVFSTFSCGGGSSLGYKLAGCDVIAANDIDPIMAEIYKKNFNPKYYFLCPIKDLLGQNLPKELYGIDILDGSPPCSSFSMAGLREKTWGKEKRFQEGQAKQVLDDLFFDYLALVEKLKPKVAIAENVKGMVTGNAKGYCKMIIDYFRRIGYQPQLFLINAADCGVPQARQRVFFVAQRNDLNRPPIVINPKEKWVTISEAIADIVLTPQEREEIWHKMPMHLTWWPRTKPGESYAEARKRAGLSESLFTNYKFHPHKPAPTITTKHHNFNHWSEPRGFCLREWRRIGGFPDDYWSPTTHSKSPSSNPSFYVVGMSVPPKMTAYVAKQVVDQWLLT